VRCRRSRRLSQLHQRQPFADKPGAGRCCSSPHNPSRVVIPTGSAGAVATKEQWRDPDTVYLTMLIQGISTRISVAGLAFLTSPACPGTAVGRSRGSRAIMAITAIVSVSSAAGLSRQTRNLGPAPVAVWGSSGGGMASLSALILRQSICKIGHYSFVRTSSIRNSFRIPAEAASHALTISGNIS